MKTSSNVQLPWCYFISGFERQVSGAVSAAPLKIARSNCSFFEKEGGSLAPIVLQHASFDVGSSELVQFDIGTLALLLTVVSTVFSVLFCTLCSVVPPSSGKKILLVTLA